MNAVVCEKNERSVDSASFPKNAPRAKFGPRATGVVLRDPELFVHKMLARRVLIVPNNKLDAHMCTRVSGLRSLVAPLVQRVGDHEIAHDLVQEQDRR